LARKTKCHECMIVDEEPKIIDEDNINKRYHATCLEVALKKKEFLKKEREQKDELVKHIMSIHGLKNSQEIPPFFYQQLEKIRNDATDLRNKHRKYKQGIPYNIILFTYQFASQDIDNYLRTGNFNDKLHELNAILFKVKNKFVDAYEHKEHMIKQKESINNEVTTNKEERTFTYKKKETQNDISQFL
jgi:hypothetical protein